MRRVPRAGEAAQRNAGNVGLCQSNQASLPNLVTSWAFSASTQGRPCRPAHGRMPRRCPASRRSRDRPLHLNCTIDGMKCDWGSSPLGSSPSASRRLAARPRPHAVPRASSNVDPVPFDVRAGSADRWTVIRRIQRQGPRRNALPNIAFVRFPHTCACPPSTASSMPLT